MMLTLRLIDPNDYAVRRLSAHPPHLSRTRALATGLALNCHLDDRRSAIRWVHV